MTLFTKRPIPQADVYSLQEASEYLRCSFTTIKRALERGDIPFRQVGKKFWIRRVALDEWLAGTDGKTRKSGKVT